MARSVGTGNISLSEVFTAITGVGSINGQTLKDAFENAQESGFVHSGRNSLLDFRGYTHDTENPSVINFRSLRHTETSVELDWYASDDTGIENLIVQYRKTSSSTWIDKGVTANFTNVTGLSSGTSYYFRVKAIDKAGRESLSSTISVTTESAVPDTISTGRTEISFRYLGGSQIVLVTADSSWNTTGDYYFSANPDTGAAGTTSVTISAPMNQGSINIRNTIRFNLNNGDDVAELYVNQDANLSGGGGLEPKCLVEGTQLLYATGEYVTIENLKEGDILTSPEINGIEGTNKTPKLYNQRTDVLAIEDTTTVVESITRQTSEHTISINNGLIRSTKTHIHFIKRDDTWTFTHVQDLEVGDILKHRNGEEIEITSIEEKHEPINVFRLVLSAPNHTFYANNIITHNSVIEPEL